MGIKLQGEEDGVVAAALARPRVHVWVIADNGYAKRTPIDDYPRQGRYGQGVITMSLPRTARGLVGGVVGRLDDKVTILTTAGTTKTMAVKSAPETARNRQGKQVLALAVRDQVAGVVMPRARPAAAETEPAPADVPPTPGAAPARRRTAAKSTADGPAPAAAPAKKRRTTTGPKDEPAPATAPAKKRRTTTSAATAKKETPARSAGSKTEKSGPAGKRPATGRSGKRKVE